MAYFFPSSMIKGILASIGLILIINQIPHAFGYRGMAEFSEAETGISFAGFLRVFDYINLGATIITLVSLAIIILWDSPALKEKYPFFKFVPAALVAVVVSVGLHLLFQSSFPALALEANHLVQLPVAEGFTESSLFFPFLIFLRLPIRKSIPLH